MKFAAALVAGLVPILGAAADAGPALARALEAEARLDSAVALQLFLEADAASPGDPVILQKIARQYSDLVLDQPTPEEKQRYARTALEFAQRAVALGPEEAVNVLSLAVCYGKLAAYSDTRTKLKYSRLVKSEAERALALDPNYAWAHHLLGRWHREVAELGMTARLLVRLWYGGLPPASFTDAVVHLDRAVQLEPGELAHWLELGFAQAAVGNVEAARAAWKHGLAMASRGKHDEPAKQHARAALEQLR